MYQQTFLYSFSFSCMKIDSFDRLKNKKKRLTYIKIPPTNISEEREEKNSWQ